MKTLGEILATIGRADLRTVFAEHRISDQLIPELTESDLRELGLKIGERKLFLRAARDSSRIEGTPTAAPSSTSSSDRGDLTLAERRRLTVMFVDLVGSTVLSSTLDPEEWRVVLNDYHGHVTEIVSELGGNVAQYLGDGALCYFGWPAAMEDAAIRAVEAALGIVARTSQIVADGRPMSCRVGISTGLVVVGKVDDTIGMSEGGAVGETPNFAARLQAIAEPNSVLISDTTRRLLGGSFILGDAVKREIKGLSGAHTIYPVFRANPAHLRFGELGSVGNDTIIGRELEVDQLRSCWAAAKDGTGQLVNIVGEAGIGKSRISGTLLASIAEEQHRQVIYQCSPYHRDTALWPVIVELTSASGIVDSDTKEERLSKLEALLDIVGSLGDANLHLLADLVGIDVAEEIDRLAMSPSGRRQATLSALVTYLVGISRLDPLLILVEDLHWADPTTVELIGIVLERLENERILTLMTSRPEQPVAMPEQPNVTEIVLRKLERSGVRQIIEKLGGGTLPDDTIDLIVERTDGVPLFIEELTKAMIENEDAQVPASLHDTLMARLDRVPEVKEIAQIASVFGREFSTVPLSSVATLSQERVLDALEKLREIELVYSRLGGNGRFLFKHALVRDAAYESLLNRRKRELHGRIFEVLREDPGAVPGELAHHAAEAGRVRDAVTYGILAVEQALRRPAYSEAIAHASNALSVTDDSMSLERRKLLVLAGQARIAHLGYAHPDTLATYTEIERIAGRTNDYDLLIDGLYGKWAGHYVPGNLPAALEVSKEILRVSERAEDDLGCALGNRLKGSVLTMMGRPAEAHAALDAARHWYDRDLHGGQAARFGQDVGIAGDCYRIGCLILENRLESAVDLAERVLRDLEAIGHLHTKGYALGHIACFLTAAGIEPLGTKVAQLCVTTSDKGRMPLWGALGRAATAVAVLRTGINKNTSDDLQSALEELDRLAFNVFRPMQMPIMANALVSMGRLDDAEEWCREASQLMDLHEGRYSFCDLLSAKADVLAAHNQLEEAEFCLREGMNEARVHDHHFWSARLADQIDGLKKARPVN